jgi:hypothetical protein
MPVMTPLPQRDLGCFPLLKGENRRTLFQSLAGRGPETTALESESSVLCCHLHVLQLCHCQQLFHVSEFCVETLTCSNSHIPPATCATLCQVPVRERGWSNPVIMILRIFEGLL